MSLQEGDQQHPADDEAHQEAPVGNALAAQIDVEPETLFRRVDDDTNDRQHLLAEKKRLKRVLHVFRT